MLNLRQLNHAADDSDSDAQHFSRFSVNFRVPSDFLENIGESLDHSRARAASEDGGDDSFDMVDELRDGEFNQQAGLSHAHWDRSRGASAA